MKKLSLLLLTLLFVFAVPIKKDKTFYYNPEKGICENCKGKKGFNDLNLENTRKTKNAECVDLSTIDLVMLHQDYGSSDFIEFGYNILEGYNFKGSKFKNSKIHFNNIEKSDFSGADLSTLYFGYAQINAKVDSYTIIPERGCLKVVNDSINCMN